MRKSALTTSDPSVPTQSRETTVLSVVFGMVLAVVFGALAASLALYGTLGWFSRRNAK